MIFLDVASVVLKLTSITVIMQFKTFIVASTLATVGVASVATRRSAAGSQICGYPDKGCPAGQKCTVANDCEACKPGGNRFAYCAGFCQTREQWLPDIYDPYDEFDGYDGHKFANCNYN